MSHEAEDEEVYDNEEDYAASIAGANIDRPMENLKGTVKRVGKGGYGFITLDEGQLVTGDVFLCYENIKGGVTEALVGKRLVFDVIPGRAGKCPRAINVTHPRVINVLEWQTQAPWKRRRL